MHAAPLALAAIALLAAPAATQTRDKPAVAPSRAIEFPDVPGAVTLVVELHTHSVFSDGSVWPDIRVQEAARDGVDILAVTEHLEYQPHQDDIPHPDRNRSYELARAHAEGGHDVIVVNGAEITRSMPPGHSNAVFLRDANPLKVDDAEGAFQAARAQGAFVLWNHPSWTGQRKDGIAVLTDMHRSLFERGLVHGVEVANGSIISPEALALALEFDLAILGTSDIHGLIDWDYDIGAGEHRTTTLVFAAERSAAAAREALFANRTVAWMDNTLIGREDVLLPLLRASLQVTDVAIRRNSTLVDVTFTNSSDARFELLQRSAHTLYDQPGLVVVPPHGSLTVGVAGITSDTLQLDFGVLNAMTAPARFAELSFTVDVPPAR